MKYKFIKFFKNTTVRVIAFLLLAAFVASIFFFQSFYKRRAYQVLSYYWVYRGDKYYKKKQPQNAINAYQKALRYYPEHYKARYNLANIYVSYEDYYSALDSYEKVLKIKPDLINARIDYAIVLAEATFNYDKAIEEYKKAIKLSPKWVYIPFIINNKNTYKHNRGVAFYNMGLAWRGKSLLAGEKTFDSRKFLEHAAESYKNALQIKQNYQSYYNLGIVYHLMKYPNLAGYNYCKAIEDEPMNYEAHYNLAILLRDLKKYDASLEEFQKAGLILDMKGESAKTRYIYDVLNDATQRMMEEGSHDLLVQKLNEQNKKTEKYLKYKNGKVILGDDFDGAMLQNFKTCADKKYFYKNRDNTDKRWN